MNDVQILDDFDQAVEESIHDDEIDALLESLSVDSDIDDDAEPAEEGIVGAAVGITMAVAGFTVMIVSFKSMLNDMKRKRILKKHPEIANKIGDCLNDVNTECFKSFESAIKKNAYFKSSEYKKVKKQKANDDDMKKFTSDCKFSVQDSNNAVSAKMVSSLRTPTYTFEYKTLEDDNANDEYIEKNIEPVENKILSEYKNVLASAITTFNSSKAKATVESKYGCKINVTFNGVDSDADADHYESNDEDIRTEYYWAYGNISIEVTFDAGKTDTKADNVDANEDAFDFDIDFDIEDAATESAWEEVPQLSVKKMIDSGMKKNDAIKSMDNFIKYMDTHKMMDKHYDEFTIDENTVVTKKDLNSKGIQFIKYCLKKIKEIPNNPENVEKLHNALKEYTEDKTKITKVLGIVGGIISVGTCIVAPLVGYKASILSLKHMLIAVNSGASVAGLGFGTAAIAKKNIDKAYNMSEESVTFEDDSDFDDDSLDSATESSMFLDMMMESCDDLDEFQDLVTENAYDWEMYGLIDDAQSALEATKVMRVENWKEKNRKRLINRECIRIAMKKGDPNYTKYKKYRDLMREYREKLFEKYTPMATRNVKAAQQNARHKAANMHTAGGKDVNARINKAMNKSIAGHNPTNAPAKSNAS